jgi:nucleolar GTP-binding protein
LVVCNKIDLKKWADVEESDKALIQSVLDDRNTQMIQMSNATEEGITTVKSTACDMLLHHRVERKLKSKRINDVINRIHVTQPVKRDDKARPSNIPASVLAARAAKEAKGGDAMEDEPRMLERDLEAEQGGAGVYNFDQRKLFALPDKWKYDVIPEIIDGKNIADFVDPDIEARLEALEKEEEELAATHAAQEAMESDSDELDEEKKTLVDKIRLKRKLIIAKRLAAKNNNKPVLPRKANRVQTEDAEETLQELGLDTTKFADRARSRARVREEVKEKVKASKRKRDEEEEAAMGADSDGDEDMGVSRRTRSKSRGMEGVSSDPSGLHTRSKSRAPRDESKKRDGKAPVDAIAYRNVKQKTEAVKKAKHAQRKANQHARASESDRRVLNDMPRHLFSGKRGIGKTDRR